jgi:hypothetical protein
MTHKRRMSRRQYSFAHRVSAFFFGALAGIHLAVLLLLGASMAVGVREVAAQSASQITPVCWYPNECLKEETVKKKVNCDDNCDKPGTECHCFETGHGCKNGAGACYLKWPAVKLAVNIGGAAKVLDLADYISKVYNFGVGAAVTVAAVFLVVGGFRWLSAGDNSEAIGAAKKHITEALIGLLLALGSFVILNTINPDILSLRLPKIPLVKKKVFAVCSQTEQCVPCGKPYVVMKPKNAGGNWVPSGCSNVAFRDPEDFPIPAECEGKPGKCGVKWTDELSKSYDLSAECVGKSCKLAGCSSDAKFRCRVPTATEKTDHPECKAPPKADGKPASAVKYACMPCLLDGEKCSPSGKNDKCCGGFCGKEQCTAGLPGDPCKSNEDCQTKLCTTEWVDLLGLAAHAGLPYACSAGAVGSPCNDNNQCAPGYKCSTFGRNTCSPGTHYSYCDGDDECQQGFTCSKSGVFMANICLSPGEEKISCNTATGKLAYFVPGMDVKADFLGYNEKCPDRMCVQSPADISPGGLVASICASGKPGTPCGDDRQCEKPAWKTGDRGFCIDNICMNGQLGELCRNNGECMSGHCYKGNPRVVKTISRTDSICVSGELGSRCTSDAGCNKDKDLTCQDSLCRFK